MGFPSRQQVLEAAKQLSFKDEGVFVRTNGLWHVLIFLRHRACHGARSQYTFESYDLAQAAFDLNGVTLPIAEDSRDVYFEPGATQGNEIQKLFRHREGPRQTYLNRIYTGLVGSGPRQPKLFDASNNALPTTVNLVADWIAVLRSLGDNKLVLDSRVQSLMTWLFRFGVPTLSGHASHMAEHIGNGRLNTAGGVVRSPIPEGNVEFQAELAKFFGLTTQDLNALFPELDRVNPAKWAEASAISPASLGAELLSFLNVAETVFSAVTEDLAELVDTFITTAEDDAKLRVEPPIITRLAGALLSKRFLILTGLAGSGKTKLAQALARWITPKSLDSGATRTCISVVPVGADWTGNENVLGYPNGLDKETYVSKPALDLIVHADAHEDVPHFLILDEMNLSHVERYFADILSVIESEEAIQLYDGAARTADGKAIPRHVELPKNLFIIGTVNVDETTYMFSPKVLDRANVIEFRMEAGELTGFLGNPAKPDLANLDGKGASFGKAFVEAAKNPVAVPDDVKAAYDAEMLLLFKTLQAHGAEFGYRTAYETARFIHFYKLLGNHPDGDTTWFPGAFDCVVFQKLLPKLHGSRAKLGPVLKKLWFLCVTPHKVDAEMKEARDKLIAATLKAAEESKAEPLKDIPDGAPYPLSAEKIYRMWRLMMDNGFASFAEA